MIFFSIHSRKLRVHSDIGERRQRPRRWGVLRLLLVFTVASSAAGMVSDLQGGKK